MIIKTVTLVSLYLIPLAVIISGIVSHPFLLFIMWVLMAMGMVGIGMSVMHDANHGSYSSNPKVNKYLGYMINLMGGSAIVWKIQHNVLHHSFTNIEGHDGDIDAGSILRLSPNSKHLWIHRLQAFYAWFLYGMMTINWATFKDFLQFFNFRKKGLTVKGRGKFTMQVTRMTIAKLIYWGVVLFLPMWLNPASWWVTLIFFLTMHFIAGVFSATVFQAAHVVPDAAYPTPEKDGKVSDSWFVHQLRTTCNFSPKSRVFSWFVGGLNYQIEHHLFPSISHVHYSKISKIVQQTAQEYGVPYHVYPNFATVLWQHTKHLWRLGNSKSMTFS
ncbi:MAG: acyl-CoA desaturase [Flavobacteriales bacterium]|nr:acyl-CoA desaturase [Flavobacteriales bacterium]